MYGGSDKATDMVDLFTMAANVALALTEGIEFNALGDVTLQRRDGWFGGQNRNIVMSALRHGQEADVAALSRFACDGGQCL